MPPSTRPLEFTCTGLKVFEGKQAQEMWRTHILAHKIETLAHPEVATEVAVAELCKDVVVPRAEEAGSPR